MKLLDAIAGLVLSRDAKTATPHPFAPTMAGRDVGVIRWGSETRYGAVEMGKSWTEWEVVAPEPIPSPTDTEDPETGPEEGLKGVGEWITV